MIADYAKAPFAGDLRGMRLYRAPHEAMIDVQHSLTRRASDESFVYQQKHDASNDHASSMSRDLTLYTPTAKKLDGQQFS